MQLEERWARRLVTTGVDLGEVTTTLQRDGVVSFAEAFRDLQAQLEGTENRIAVERKRFNEAAQAYNTTRRRFPAVVLANIMGFSEYAYFESTAGAERPPEVEL